MFVFFVTLAVTLFAGPAVRAGSVLCEQWDTETGNGTYNLENNLWGQNNFTGGQCSHSPSLNDSTVAWTTEYDWFGGPGQVKSYANIDLQVGLQQQIFWITSIPSTWNWSYANASSNLIADVSYDLWLSEFADGSGANSTTTSYEIMIWLSSRGGAEPAGSQIDTAMINGLTWKLYKGSVSTWTVYSFVAPSELTEFNQDLLPFVTYLTSNQSVSTSQYLVQLQAGTQPFEGSAYMTTSAYSTVVVLNEMASVMSMMSATPTMLAARGIADDPVVPTPVWPDVSHYGQCGGQGYTGSPDCASPYTCQVQNPYYFQCL